MKEDWHYEKSSCDVSSEKDDIGQDEVADRLSTQAHYYLNFIYLTCAHTRYPFVLNQFKNNKNVFNFQQSQIFSRLQHLQALFEVCLRRPSSIFLTPQWQQQYRDRISHNLMSIFVYPETQQLINLKSYNQSIDYLSKNSLKESLLYLTYALEQAKNAYPYSINLHNCLMNRTSILHKLLSNNREFQTILEEIYLVTVSSKGPRHLNTMKSLINYLIALMIYNPQKFTKVLQFIKAEQNLPEYLLFFDAVNDIRCKKFFKEGILKLEKLPQEKTDEKIFKYNNIGFMTIHMMREEFKNPVQYLGELKKQGEGILKHFLKALIFAENSPEFSSSYSEEQIRESQKLIFSLEGYLSKEKPSLPTEMPSSKDVLKHSNSHIIAMNIASVLFELERFKESFYFLQLSLDKAVNLSELQRVGMALILLARCYFHQQNQKWEEIILDILSHSSTYPKFIVKEALTSYSRLLFQKGRLFEAENYLNQSLTIECESGLEGLILPSYDFSF